MSMNLWAYIDLMLALPVTYVLAVSTNERQGRNKPGDGICFCTPTWRYDFSGKPKHTFCRFFLL